jgi:SAM-dependent methyltransferase
VTTGGYIEVDPATAVRVNRTSWDGYADEYQREHGGFLGDARFVWCPEGWDEADVRLLGDVAGRRVLEIGSGAGQCARWLRTRGADVVGLDLSVRQLQHGRRLDEETGVSVPSVCGSALELPIATASVDLACSAFGAFPFLVDVAPAFAEVARVLRPGGRLVFSVVHPVRWMFDDDPSLAGTTVVRSYFDRRPYVEQDDLGEPGYVEAHHTLHDWLLALDLAGLRVTAVHEPEWPVGHQRVWGGWGPERGALVPGTLILSALAPHDGVDVADSSTGGTDS